MHLAAERGANGLEHYDQWLEWLLRRNKEWIRTGYDVARTLSHHGGPKEAAYIAVGQLVDLGRTQMIKLYRDFLARNEGPKSFADNFDDSELREAVEKYIMPQPAPRRSDVDDDIGE